MGTHGYKCVHDLGDTAMGRVARVVGGVERLTGGWDHILVKA